MLDLKEIKNKSFYHNDLYHDFVFDFDRVSSFYFYDFRKTDQFKKRAEDIFDSYDSNLRGEVAEILKDNNIRYGCSEKTLENIRNLKDRDTLVVIGGQQPGLFAGPVFIIYKMISIIKLSIMFAEVLKTKVVPIFWNASDDGNFSQVNSAFFLNNNLSSMRLSLNELGLPGSGKRFSDIFFNEDFASCKIAELLGLLHPTDFTKSIGSFLDRCMKTCFISTHKSSNFSGNDKSSAVSLPFFFSVIISKLFFRHGLVIMDPYDLRLKKIALESVYFDIKNSSLIAKKIKESTKLLAERGYHSQLEAEKNGMNFFLVKNGIRKKVYEIDKNHYTCEGTKISNGNLKLYLRENPDKISLNVILRPMFQDTVFPVLATVCGPGEVSYFAQLRGVYELAGKKSGIIYPRFSATIIENKIARLLERIGIDYSDIDPDRRGFYDKVIRSLVPVDLEELLRNFKNDVFLSIKNLKESVEKSGIVLKSSFGRIERNFGKEVSVLNKKIISEFRNKHDILEADIAKLYMHVFPENRLQERLINIFNYINKYDFSFLDSLFDAIDMSSHFHRFIFFR